MEKIKISKIEEIFSKMRVPLHPWDGETLKIVDKYAFVINNEDEGYISYDCFYDGKLIFHKNDGAGDYDFVNKFVEDNQ